MRKTLTTALLGAALLGGVATTASADSRVGVHLSFGFPAPVVIAPAPVYYPEPRVVYMPPPRVIYTPVVVHPRHPHWRHKHHGHGHRHGHGRGHGHARWH